MSDVSVLVHVWGYDRSGRNIDGLDHRRLPFARMPVVGDRLEIDERTYLVRKVVLWPLSEDRPAVGEIDADLEDGDS